jgi:Tol biopolymer transport system component
MDRDSRALVKGPENYAAPVITPDRQWLLYTEYRRDGTARLMRTPIAGGPAAVLLMGEYSYDCASAPSTVCLLAELKGNQLVFSVLDPVTGHGSEMTRFEWKDGPHMPAREWRLSPDGWKIALVDGTEKVRILSTRGGAPRDLQLKGWVHMRSVNWSADGTRLYLSGQESVSTSGIVETDLAGNYKALMQIPNNRGLVSDPTASPDGRFLIYTEKTSPSEVMLVEHF